METVKKQHKPIEDIIATILDGQISSAEIKKTVSLKEIGLESLQFVRLILEIEQEYGRKIFCAENLGNIQTLDDLYSLTEEKKK